MRERCVNPDRKTVALFVFANHSYILEKSSVTRTMSSIFSIPNPGYSIGGEWKLAVNMFDHPRVKISARKGVLTLCDIEAS